MDKFRVGIGQDSHVISENLKIKNEKWEKCIILGGVLVDENLFIQTNADGDLLLHALFNALSSAIGEHSIGVYADKMCLVNGIKDSKEFVRVVMEKVKKAGYIVNNVSIAIEAKIPRVSIQQVDQMKVIIGKLLFIPIHSIGITFTSGEGLTAFGKGKGIQAIVIVSLVGI